MAAINTTDPAGAIGPVYDGLIYSAAQQLGSVIAMCAVCQARFESGDYTSRLCQGYNNAFGYNYVPTKWQSGKAFANPDGGTFASYDNVGNSAQDLVAWWQNRQNNGFDLSTIVDIPTYVQALNRFGYFGTGSVSNYTSGMQAKYKNVDWANLNSGISLTPVVIAAIAAGAAVVLYLLLKD